MSSPLLNWATPKLSRLLPLDDHSLTEILQYTSTLSKADGAEHLKNLLGDSPQALEFISGFNSRREEVGPPTSSAAAATLPAASLPTAVGVTSNVKSSRATEQSDRVPAVKKHGVKKSRAPLHTAGPVRRPDDYGNVAGGYRKSDVLEDEYGPSKSRSSGHGNGHGTTSLSDSLTFSQQPAALQAPKVSTGAKTPSPLGSRDPSPGRHQHQQQKLPPSAHGPLISDLLPNVKSKQSRKPAHSGSSTPHKSTTTTTSSINDLTAAIAALELSTNPALSSERRVCGCHATIHPLFEPAPNCLSCGQIICALEGLQPCSFCDSPILTPQQVQTMIRTLRDERGTEKMDLHNATISKSGRGTPALGGTPRISTPESSSGDEMSAAAAKARAHRDKLLAFQRDNAQRTRVHDEAADYDMTVTPGATQWMSPAQRALALKKQQKYLREMEEERRPEWEKKKTVMSMSIKNGKLVRTYETVKADRPAEREVEHEEIVADDINSDADSRTSKSKSAFGRNPLLAGGGLVRPVWKSSDEGKGKEVERKERKQTWRRVQDDNDDNERWILDGGIYGQGGEEQATATVD